MHQCQLTGAHVCAHTASEVNMWWVSKVCVLGIISFACLLCLPGISLHSFFFFYIFNAREHFHWTIGYGSWSALQVNIVNVLLPVVRTRAHACDQIHSSFYFFSREGIISKKINVWLSCEIVSTKNSLLDSSAKNMTGLWKNRRKHEDQVSQWHWVLYLLHNLIINNLSIITTFVNECSWHW